MPKEFRKRGKKTKKAAEKDETNILRRDQPPREDYTDNYEEEPQAGRSWIIPASKNSEETNLEAPFGYLDADVKAYFRTVDVQIRNWQENEAEAKEINESMDPNEGSTRLVLACRVSHDVDTTICYSERRLFFVAALTETSKKEKQLATDPDCSNILERMAYSMDDFARRVFVDRLAGS
jgi:nucleolar protein 9